MITIENLSKSFGEKVALDINQLSISKGEALGLVGNNGAGKTTFFNLMLDLLKPSTGNVFSMDQIVYGSNHWKEYTNAFIDTDFLIDFLSPQEYFHFLGSSRGVTNEEVDATLELYSEFISDDIKEDNYIRDLSKGNKTRVGILGALVGNPEVLIFDEPFSSLDPSSQLNLRNLFNKLKEQGKTLLISSHDLEHVSKVCNRIVILEKGQIKADIDENEINLEELRSYFV
jgi:ABC-2 type transport system ATP-binding protein